LLRTQKIERQKTFGWLRGDKTKRRPKGTLLRVDGYFPDKHLVVEYHGRQHFKPNRLMDRRPGRSAQRKKYTRRRQLLIPRHGLKILEIRYDDKAALLAKRR
jgi:very-short-patch-repair endonuclease